MQNVLRLLPLISCRCANLTSIIFCNDLNRWPPACADTGYLFEINGCCLCAISLHLSLPFCVLFTGFLCWLEPYLYGVCERRVLPGTAPHLCGEVNRPPPEGLRYPETPLTASALGTADFSQRPSGILRSPWPDCSALSQPIRKPFAFYFLLEQPITNSSPEWGKLIGWLLDSLLIFFCVIIFLLLTFFGFVFFVVFFFFFSFFKTSQSTVD